MSGLKTVGTRNAFLISSVIAGIAALQIFRGYSTAQTAVATGQPAAGGS